MENRYKILAVDDEKFNLLLLESCLQSESCDLVTCNDALKAFSEFKKADFDVILLDILMDGIDGFEVRQLIRSRNKKIPIIFLTSLLDDINSTLVNRITADQYSYYLNKSFNKKTLIEKIEQAVQTYRESAAANGFANLRYLNRDIRRPLPDIANCSFHHVITNPPYAEHDMPSPNPGKAFAHNFRQFDLASWIAFALKMMRPKGHFYMINRTEAVTEILSALRGKAGAITIVPLYSKKGQDAKRVLVSARKDSKAPARILPGLVVHNDDGSYSAAAERILRGGECLPNLWSVR